MQGSYSTNAPEGSFVEDPKIHPDDKRLNVACVIHIIIQIYNTSYFQIPSPSFQHIITCCIHNITILGICAP